MSTTTPNRGFVKAASGDDVEQTAVDDYAGNFDILDTHKHPVTDLTATGTADSTTYLRGDGIWATPAGIPTTLDGLSDVDTTGETSGQGLVFNGTGWVPQDVATQTELDAETSARTSADTTNASNLTAHTSATGTAVHGLGTIATQSAGAVAITGGTITGITALGVPAGGTGAATLTGLVKGNGTSAMTAVTAPTGAIVGTSDSQTLTNKTLTAPALTSPTGIVKGDVGLGNVDNTSDVNKPVSTAQAAADAVVQAFAIQRANHTGTQLAATISDFATAKRSPESRITTRAMLR